MLLFDCLELHSWWSASIPILSEINQQGCFVDLATWGNANGAHEANGFSKFFCIAWGLWGCRNQMIYESNHSVPIVAIERTLSIMASHQLSLAARTPPMD